jgi:hypothetical protein
MRLFREKCLLFFFSLMMLGIQIIAAQDKNPKQILIEESDRPSPEIESPAPASSLFTPSPVFAGQSGEINQKEGKRRSSRPLFLERKKRTPIKTPARARALTGAPRFHSRLRFSASNTATR